MNEIKIINVELKSKRYSECQIYHNYETEYNLNLVFVIIAISR